MGPNHNDSPRVVVCKCLIQELCEEMSIWGLASDPVLDFHRQMDAH